MIAITGQGQIKVTTYSQYHKINHERNANFLIFLTRPIHAFVTITNDQR